MPNYRTSFNTTSAPSTSRTMATTALTSINSSAEDCVEEGGRNTSSLVGDETGCQSTKHTPPPISSQIKPKRNMESASLSDSSISATSSSSRCAKKSKTSNGRLQVPTENHLKLRKAIDAGERWEFDLEQVHGLTDEEACVCALIVTKHLHDESFPPWNGNQLTKPVQEGQKTLKPQLVSWFEDFLQKVKCLSIQQRFIFNVN